MSGCLRFVECRLGQWIPRKDYISRPEQTAGLIFTSANASPYRGPLSKAGICNVPGGSGLVVPVNHGICDDVCENSLINLSPIQVRYCTYFFSRVNYGILRCTMQFGPLQYMTDLRDQVRGSGSVVMWTFQQNIIALPVWHP